LSFAFRAWSKSPTFSCAIYTVRTPLPLAMSVTHALPPTAIELLTLRNLTMPVSRDVVFHDLQSLTLDEVSGEDSSLPSTALPSLRALRLSGVQRELFALCNSRSTTASLPYGQLDMIQVDIGDFRRFPRTLRDRGALVLLTVRLDEVSELSKPRFAKFEHIQVPASFFSRNGHIGVRQLCDFVGRSCHLQSLCLPTIFSPQSRVPLRSPNFVAARDELLAMCEGQSVDVIWRPYAEMAEDDLGVSKEFWEYAKEVKRKKEEEVEKVAMMGGVA
jgi:hypothetical protein